MSITQHLGMFWDEYSTINQKPSISVLRETFINSEKKEERGQGKENGKEEKERGGKNIKMINCYKRAKEINL